MCDLTNSGSLVSMFVKSDPMTLLKTELERKKRKQEEKREKGRRKTVASKKEQIYIILLRELK